MPVIKTCYPVSIEGTDILHAIEFEPLFGDIKAHIIVHLYLTSIPRFCFLPTSLHININSFIDNYIYKIINFDFAKELPCQNGSNAGGYKISEHLRLAGERLILQYI